MSTAKKASKKATKKAVVKKAAVKKAVAKKAVAKKAPAKKAAVKKPAVKKAAVKKPAATKKTAAKKKSPVLVPTGESVDAHIGAITDPGRRQDCRTLVEVFRQATGKTPRMWGGSIVAFGKYHYKYASGREGDSCLAGFASRKGALTLYLMGAIEGQQALMARLGKHRTGKGCIYLKDLDGVDLEALGELVKVSADYVRLHYPTSD
jgi:hypothetical protein